MDTIKLEIKDLWASVEDKQILKGVNLTINGGEIHAVMGPNGNGKSTLASVIMGHPAYTVDKGQVLFNGVDVLKLPVNERAKLGIFLGMQYPAEVGGVTNMQFLRMAAQSVSPDERISYGALRKEVGQLAKTLKMSAELPNRYLNEGFSGGEKKRNEVLQMLVLKPKFVMLDEIDSGLDIDALVTVGENVTNYAKERGKDSAFLIITHYQRLLNYIKPDFVHILYEGKIVQTGGAELALKLESEGYQWLKD